MYKASTLHVRVVHTVAAVGFQYLVLLTPERRLPFRSVLQPFSPESAHARNCKARRFRQGAYM